MTDAAPDSVGFPRLDDGQLVVVEGLGQRRSVEIGEVIVVPAEVFRSRVLSDVRLSDTVLEAFIARRAALQATAADTLQIIGSVHTPASMALREFASRNRLPHR